MKPIFRIKLVIIFVAAMVSCDPDAVSPRPFAETFRKINVDESAALSELVSNLFNDADSSNTRNRTTAVNQEIGKLLLDQAIERVASENQVGPNYTIRLIPPDNIVGTVEYLIMVATNTGYSAYILQVEPVKGFSGSIFKSLSGYVRILDLKRSTQSEAYFENGNQVNAAGKNGRINTLYTGCECVYAIKPVIGPIGGDDISDEAGYDVWIDCTCNSGGGGGATQGGNGDQGGIGTPIGGESPSGDRGGKGGIAQGGGGVGEVLGFEDLEPCPQGTWSKTGGCCPYGTDNEGLCLTQQAYELIQLLKADPLALLEIPCEQIPKWKEIAQHRLPKEIVDTISVQLK